MFCLKRAQSELSVSENGEYTKIDGSLEDILTSTSWSEQMDIDLSYISPTMLADGCELKLSPLPDSAFFELETPVECPKTVLSLSKAAIVNKLTPEQRREKILRYLCKKNRRQFNRKISYCSRKQVAEKRIRGRFATKQKARKSE